MEISFPVIPAQTSICVAYSPSKITKHYIEKQHANVTVPELTLVQGPSHATNSPSKIPFLAAKENSQIKAYRTIQTPINKSLLHLIA